MKWSSKVELVRKGIEGVLGIFKARFKILKNFNSLKHHASIDNAFVTCCVLHNMLLESGGWLDPNLPPYPGGLEENCRKNSATFMGINEMAPPVFGSLWRTVPSTKKWSAKVGVASNQQLPTTKMPGLLLWAKVTAALVDHHQFGTVIMNWTGLFTGGASSKFLFRVQDAPCSGELLR
jgi:hypothetical protein